MCADADSIDDLDLLRSGGMKELFGNASAPSTFGTLLREFTFGNNRQFESVLCERLISLAPPEPIFSPDSPNTRSSTSIPYYAPSTTMQNKAPPTDTRRLPVNRSFAKVSHRSQRHSGPPIPHRSSPGCDDERAKPVQIKAQV